MEASIRDHLIQSDETLGGIISQIPEPEFLLSGAVFHDLTSCVIEQQIHYRSSKKTFQKLLDKAELAHLTLQNFEIFERAGLADASLSIKKLETLDAVVQFFSKGAPDWSSMTDSAVRKTLSGVKGIGPWTIDMILLYTLGRPNIFPVNDYHLRQIMVKVYEIQSPQRLNAQLKSIAEPWEPFRSYGVRYLLGWKAHQKQFSKKR